MGKFDWNKYEESPAPKEQKFNWDDHPVVESDEAGQSGFISDSLQTLGAPKFAADWSEKNIYKPVLENVVAPIGRAIDSIGGAPTRAAIGAYQDNKSPIDAFANQFGEDPSKAPTGKDIAIKAGISEKSISDVVPSLYNESGEGWRLQRGGWADPSAAGTAGFGVDIVADPTNFIPVGAVAKEVGKLGVGAGKGVAKAGGKVAIATLEGAAKGADLATGSKFASGALDAAKDTGEALSRSISDFVSPSRASNWESVIGAAERQGIDPSNLSESLEFGPNSFISRQSRQLAEGKTGQDLLEKHNAGLSQIEGKLDSRLNEMSGGRAPEKFEAGEIVQRGLDDFRNQVFGKDDITYQSVMKYAPGLMIDRDAWAAINSKLVGLERRAKAMAMRGPGEIRSQGEGLLREIEQFKNVKPSYKQVVEYLQDLGSVAFPDGSLRGKFNTQPYQDLYFALREGLVDTVEKHVSPEFANELKANNARYSEYLDNYKATGGDKISEMAPENILGKIFSDSKRAQSFRGSVSPETFQQAKSAWIKSLVPYNARGDVEWGTFANVLNKKRPLLESVLSPEEMRHLDDLSFLGANYGPAILSSSGTGASISFGKDMAKDLGNAALNRANVKRMIEKARSKGASGSSVGSRKILDESGTIDAELLEKMGYRALGKRENPLSQSLKASQVYSAIQERQKNKRK